MSKSLYRVVGTAGKYRITDKESGPLKAANRFLRGLEVRGLSPRTIRAYAYDLLALYRWLDDEQKEIEQLRRRTTDLRQWLDQVTGQLSSSFGISCRLFRQRRKVRQNVLDGLGHQLTHGFGRQFQRCIRRFHSAIALLFLRQTPVHYLNPKIG